MIDHDFLKSLDARMETALQDLLAAESPSEALQVRRRIYWIRKRLQAHALATKIRWWIMGC